MDILQGLKNFLLTNINTQLTELSTEAFPLTQLQDKNIVIDEVDTDKYLSEVMIYIIPDEYNYQRDTYSSDFVTQRISIFIFVRKDTSENLIRKLFLYNNAFKAAVRSNLSLNDLVDDCVLVSQTFYQGVEGTKDIKGMEYNINLTYQEEY